MTSAKDFARWTPGSPSWIAAQEAAERAERERRELEQQLAQADSDGMIDRRELYVEASRFAEHVQTGATFTMTESLAISIEDDADFYPVEGIKP